MYLILYAYEYNIVLYIIICYYNLNLKYNNKQIKNV